MHKPNVTERHTFCLNCVRVVARVLGDSHISHLRPKALGILLMRTKGVSPILYRMFGSTVGAGNLGRENKRWSSKDSVSLDVDTV